MAQHTVEKIGGTSMSNYSAVRDNIVQVSRPQSQMYQRIFVVSAYGGMTNALLEHKKTREPGVYALFANNDSDWQWSEALTDTAKKMRQKNAELFQQPHLLKQADQFITERMEGVRSCLLDLQRVCSYGHFQINEHLATVREMLAGVGEAHSAFNTALLLQAEGVNARFVDLSGWREPDNLPLDEKIKTVFSRYDFANEMPIVTGYTQCQEGLMGTFDRGYSEITFSKIAELTDAREAVIHKEYHLSTADPLVVGEHNVKPIGRTNYDIADQLSLIGMEAIHPKAAKGLRKQSIPLRVKNTFEPEHDGTLITNDYRSQTPRVEIIAGIRHVYALNVFDQDMVGEPEQFIEIQRLVQEFNVSLLAKEHNANTVTLYLDTGMKVVERIQARLERYFPNAEMSSRKVAMVSVMGSDMSVPGILASMSGALADKNINVMAVYQGIRQVDVRIVIEEDHYDATIAALHEALIERPGYSVKAAG
ncbi:aspartate kinase [Reinekea thalattae]|uniref:aspartate kinase n=1 Tax=Reinekea thalattae TaxID=2593301 RepID=A0A5C8ZD83_9GAMM|nr:aspartate kinase [Reinekea thalattae]TXR54820.1 aspartate kinase [Reinekea thalattae]